MPSFRELLQDQKHGGLWRCAQAAAGTLTCECICVNARMCVYLCVHVCVHVCVCVCVSAGVRECDCPCVSIVGFIVQSDRFLQRTAAGSLLMSLSLGS